MNHPVYLFSQENVSSPSYLDVTQSWMSVAAAALSSEKHSHILHPTSSGFTVFLNSGLGKVQVFTQLWTALNQGYLFVEAGKKWNSQS